MIRLETTTRALPATVLRLARAFFGERYGLAETSADATSVTFEGGGGGVTVSAQATRAGTVVEITSREWDEQARQFAAQLRRAT
ncbi:MAG: hypothetical protein RMM58_11990 [Chloroflexota bacterium]|nr:hypothetical protein [Dehalococcoidia bacterium]MDW8254587.1 hypothetical protein [Chloroflexota bacterium]